MGKPAELNPNQRPLVLLPATTTTDGAMSAEDKVRLNSLIGGAKFTVGPVGTGAQYTNIQTAIDDAVAIGGASAANPVMVAVLGGEFTGVEITMHSGIWLVGYGVVLNNPHFVDVLNATNYALVGFRINDDGTQAVNGIIEFINGNANTQWWLIDIIVRATANYYSVVRSFAATGGKAVLDNCDMSGRQTIVDCGMSMDCFGCRLVCVDDGQGVPQCGTAFLHDAGSVAAKVANLFSCYLENCDTGVGGNDPVVSNFLGGTLNVYGCRIKAPIGRGVSLNSGAFPTVTTLIGCHVIQVDGSNDGVAISPDEVSSMCTLNIFHTHLDVATGAGNNAIRGLATSHMNWGGLTFGDNDKVSTTTMGANAVHKTVDQITAN